MKITRRKVLKSLCLSTAAIALNPLIGGCGKIDEGLANNPIDTQKELDARNLVKKFCEDNISGNFYTNKRYLNKINNSGFSPAYDFAAVVNKFKIVSSKIIGNTVKIWVEFDYLGVHKANDFYFYNSNNNSNKITAKYLVTNGVMKNGVRPFLQKELYKNHLRESLVRSVNLIANSNSENMKIHYIRQSERYNNILALIG